MAAIYYKVKSEGKWVFRKTPEGCECRNCIDICWYCNTTHPEGACPSEVAE